MNVEIIAKQGNMYNAKSFLDLNVRDILSCDYTSSNNTHKNKYHKFDISKKPPIEQTSKSILISHFESFVTDWNILFSVYKSDKNSNCVHAPFVPKSGLFDNTFLFSEACSSSDIVAALGKQVLITFIYWAMISY